MATTALIASVGVANAASISTLDNNTLYISVNTSTTPNEAQTGGPNFGQTPNTYGQTFTVDALSRLDAFQFEIFLDENTTQVTYNAFLYNWSDDGLGSQIKSFGSIETNGVIPGSVITGLDVESDNIILGTGMYAILYESVSGGPAGWGATTCIDDLDCNDAYEDGQFLFSTSFNSGHNDNSQASFFQSSNLDSAFQMNFTEINEPAVVPVGAALPLLATGLLGFGALGLRRRKS